MKNFKVEVSKWVEKFTFYRKSINEAVLRDELHKEWFSILSVVPIDDIEVSWNKFYFEIEQNWALKTWTISSNDIFKAFLKIKYDLKYDLKYIYLDKDSSVEEKQKIINDLNNQYNLYLESSKKEIKKKQDQVENKIENTQEVSIDNFQMKKELDETYKVIDKVLVKLKYFLELPESEILNYDKKMKLKDIFNLIIKLKTSTNIVKLRQIWEIALTKIWEIEMQVLESKKDEETRNLLKETNKLLKQVWSKKSYIEKDKDILFILWNFFANINSMFKSYVEENTKQKPKFEIDKQTYIFLKNKLLLEKYNYKLNLINKEILNNFLVFLIPTKENQEKKENLLIRKKVLLQNQKILQSRLTWKTYSYVKIMKWYDYFIDNFLKSLKFLTTPIFIIITTYSLLFCLFLLLNSLNIINYDINFTWMFYFIYMILAFVILNLSKWILSLSFNIVILNFLFIFWVINF